tara:strand:- start:608 stop:760 length:153 start_codon:yes stop_codon:yes gene_type:complete
MGTLDQFFGCQLSDFTDRAGRDGLFILEIERQSFDRIGDDIPFPVRVSGG